MRVVVAPDKFKGCLSALDVARAVATGIQSCRPDAVTTVLPVPPPTTPATLSPSFAGRSNQPAVFQERMRPVPHSSSMTSWAR